MVATWLFAATLATVLASQAVALIEVGDSQPLSVPLAAQSVPPTTVASATPTTTTTAGSATTPTTSPSATAATSPSTSQPTPTSSVATSSVATTTSTSPPLAAGSVVTGGGTVTLECTAADSIAFVGAVPNPGWTVHLDENKPERVKVEFERGADEVELEASCESGSIVHQIST